MTTTIDAAAALATTTVVAPAAAPAGTGNATDAMGFSGVVAAAIAGAVASSPQLADVSADHDGAPPPESPPSAAFAVMAEAVAAVLQAPLPAEARAPATAGPAALTTSEATSPVAPRPSVTVAHQGRPGSRVHVEVATRDVALDIPEPVLPEPAGASPAPATARTSVPTEPTSQTDGAAEAADAVAVPSVVSGPVVGRTEHVPATATATATATPVTPEAPPVAQQVVEVLALLPEDSDGTHRITLRLRPAELGEVVLDVQLTGNELDLVVHADDDAARVVLGASLADLRADLEQAGYRPGRLDVGTGDRRDGSGRGTPTGDASRATAPAPVTAPTPSEPIAVNGLDVRL